jgi:hypothetical protein
MRTACLLGALPVVLLLGTGSPASRPVDACQSLNGSSLGGYRNLIGKALAAARADAQANGIQGRYAVAATNTRDLLHRSYDRATEMVDFRRNQGDRNPNTTNYVEGGNYKAYLHTIPKLLPDAAHWATISASYHRSQQAMEAFNVTLDALEQGGRLIGEAGLCFTAPYLSGAATAG